MFQAIAGTLLFVLLAIVVPVMCFLLGRLHQSNESELEKVEGIIAGKCPCCGNAFPKKKNFQNNC